MRPSHCPLICLVESALSPCHSLAEGLLLRLGVRPNLDMLLRPSVSRPTSPQSSWCLLFPLPERTLAKPSSLVPRAFLPQLFPPAVLSSTSQTYTGVKPSQSQSHMATDPRAGWPLLNCEHWMETRGMMSWRMFNHRLSRTQACARVHTHCVYIQVGKESTGNAGDPGSIPGLGRSTGEGIGYPLHILGFPLWLSW